MVSGDEGFVDCHTDARVASLGSGETGSLGVDCLPSGWGEINLRKAAGEGVVESGGESEAKDGNGQ